MPILSPQAAHVLAHPGRFAWCVLKAFKANQGLLPAGAVAYYALLSVVPLLILTVIALSHVIAAISSPCCCRTATSSAWASVFLW